MIPRRDLVTGGLFGGLVGALSASDAAGAQSPPSDQAVERVATAIGVLRAELRDQHAFLEIEALRQAQKQYLRANGKFPDYIDVGIDLWFAVHDWHVRWQQPLTLGRDGQGRYTVMLLATTIVARPDSAANFIGIPYDNR